MAGPVTDSSGQIVKKNGNGGGDTLAGFLQKMGPEIARALPRHMTPDRMGRIVLTALRTTRDLALCTRESFAGCVMQASQLGLEPNTPLGHLYLIPRRNKRLPPDQRDCTMIIGYQGFIELARRSGLVSSIYAYAVREGDFFEYELGLNPDVRHKPSEDAGREERPISHVYAVAGMKDSNDRVFVVLTAAQIAARRKRSAASGDGPWVTDYEAMCLKTAVRSLWKWLPKSVEIARATAIDDAAEAGTSQVAAFDPTVSEALAKHGLLPDDAELIDPETGEVQPSEPHVEPEPQEAQAELIPSRAKR